MTKSQASDSAAAQQAGILPAETGARTVEDGGTGPYPALMASDSTLATHTIFRPRDLAVFDGKNRLPVFAWGNGACANSPWEHLNFLSEVASHGFLVIAIGPMPGEGERGSGRSKSSQLIDAIDWAAAQNDDPSGPYHGKIDIHNMAVGGMSCGGLQAYEAAPDPRVKTVMICNSGIFIPGTEPGGGRGGLPGMPALTKDLLAKLHSPVLYLLGGESDIAYRNGMDDFVRVSHVPVFAANLDVGHGGTYGRPHGGDFAVVATAWLKWRLKGDADAGRMFSGDSCGVSRMPGWRVEKKNIP
ncbi:alpha/beta hydrolase [bacterium]|nr:alpha/beta hydrolase [bacterium]